ncbi:MAG: ParB/RepB/Spo0J family partition protein [Proteobacteria bacterium]|jgi:ParB family chromosome partitioning protein|nr:ParB/RepB/Spo0J family partition protein [Desulfocapsa sp.]MBU3944636.1 ParB/RepB/Spo0J family partition protein [Pseudomonadota bacterium]MCG2743236.1 ParB/RepB/Spo0J family partition protein [Desulfobacteraceae bacterium]MDO8948396.1 ParB/RepB/Spo0J family partition protein [Desulfocapsaceae bacterium]MBU4030283.1 ParB/RepB/Spo0J family partition protein [Pseudomonadota bacterium]
MSVKKTGLGQGVSLLFAQEDEEEKYFECDIDKIIPNKHQPRSYFEEQGLEELTQSIEEHGVIQPLVVTNQHDGYYQLIAGERRLRASQRAGLKKVPVIVRAVENDDSLLELALIENIQRKDLNVIEEAEAYNKLIEKFNYTQEQAAQRVGKKRSTITNILRLLQLPGYIKNDLEQGALTEGHARVLLRILDTPIELQNLRDQIIQKNLSVRQTEKSIRKTKGTGKPSILANQASQSVELSQSYCTALTNQLTNVLHSKVTISQSGNRGKIEIEYYSLDDLERVIELIAARQTTN